MDPTPEERRLIEARIGASPVKDLIHSFQGSPFAAAPERKIELERMGNSIGVRIQLVWPGTEFQFGAVDHKYVRVGLCTLERLWAYVYCYYKSYLLVGNNPPGTWVDREREIVDLLQWAHTGAASPIENPWPGNAPRPDVPGSGDQLPVANEIFLMMVAWIFLHEFGHIVRQDRYDDGPNGQLHNHGIEFAADDWAYRFLLEHWRIYSENRDVYLKRGIGIAFAIFVFSADRFFKGGVVQSHTHPHPVDRLLKFLDYIEAGQTSYSAETLRIEYAACVCLYGILARHIPADEFQKEFDTPRACIEYLRLRYRPIQV